MITYNEVAEKIQARAKAIEKQQKEEVRNFCDTLLTETINEAIEKGCTNVTVEMPDTLFTFEQKQLLFDILRANGYNGRVTHLNYNKAGNMFFSIILD